MRKNSRRIISILLAMIMLFSLCTQGLATSPTGQPSGSTLPSADATYNARIRVADGARDTTSELADSKTPLTTATGGKVSDSTAEGVKIQSTIYGDSGVYVTGDSSDSYVFGGSKNNYTISGKKYNSVINLNLNDSDRQTATDSYGREMSGGFGIGVSGAKALVENAYIHTDGPGRPATYTSNQGTLIVKDSYVESTGGSSSFIPGFKLLNGSARTNLTMGGTTYFYNSAVKASAWGAMSTDTGGENNTYLYAYNTYAEATGGGYGTYSDTNCFVYLYGSKLVSGEFGAIIASNGELHVDSGANASAEVKANLDSDDQTTTQGSTVIGARNAVMIHVVDPFGATGTDSSGLKYAGTLDVKNSTLSTVTDFTSAGDYVNDKKVGASEPYINHHLGSVILFRGGNANVSLENVKMNSSNDTLIHSVVDYDPGGAVYAVDGQEFLGINVSLKNMTLEGNILHEDYQRKMSLSLTNTSLNGKIVSGTMTGWNTLWSSYSSEIQGELIQDTSYQSVWGLTMTMDATSSWVVSETSSLASLTIQEGVSITAPEGYTMTIYTGCDMGNDNVFYDFSKATELTAFKAGVTYTGVVIVVTKSQDTAQGEGGFGGGGMGGPGGGDRGADSSYSTFENVKGAASVLIDGNNIYSANDKNSSTTFKGMLTVADGGSITASSISGVNIAGKDYSTATEDSSTDNGIAITKDDASDIVYVGNSTDFYDVDVDGKGTIKSFNSLITLKNEETVDDTLEGNDGVGIILGKGGMVLDNVYIKTDGMRSPAIYNIEPDSTVVVKNSWLQTEGGKSWHPIFTLLTASTRAALLYGGETWFYNDTIVTQDWGCLSQEGQNDGTKTYSINSYLEAYNGGYGAYVLDGNFMYFYGTEMQATDYAIFLCGKVGVDVGAVESALGNSTIVKNMSDYGVSIDKDNYQVEGGKSLIAATINAIVVHTNGAVGTSTLNVKDSIVTTDTEHGLKTVGVTGEPINLDISWRWNNADDSKFNSGESWFAMKNMWGSIAVVRSMEANLTFDNADLYASNGVLLQSIIAYDPNGSTTMYRASGDAAKEGILATYANNNYIGDILHEDYQRQMTVNLQGATLSGKIISGTMAAWNAKWDAETLKAKLEDAGLDTTALTDTRIAAIQAALVKDTSYDGDVNKTGVNLTIDAGSKWIATGTSSLGSLTVADGGAIVAPAGDTLTIYTGADTSSGNKFYDYSKATKLTKLEAGVTYHDVVIVVTSEKMQPFTDVYAYDWYYDGIQFAVDQGLLTGTSQTTIEPNTTMTRAMLVTILYRMAGEPAVTDTTSFGDVAANQWYTNAITWAETCGITTGYTDGSFGVNDPITREQLAIFLYRFAQLQGHNVNVNGDTEMKAYADYSDISSTSLEAVSYMVGTGLLKGIGNNTLSLQSHATRAQVAVVLQRLAAYYGI